MGSNTNINYYYYPCIDILTLLDRYKAGMVSNWKGRKLCLDSGSSSSSVWPRTQRPSVMRQ